MITDIGIGMLPGKAEPHNRAFHLGGWLIIPFNTSSPHQPDVDRIPHHLRQPSHAQFIAKSLATSVHCTWADVHHLGDLLAAVALGDQGDDLGACPRMAFVARARLAEPDFV